MKKNFHFILKHITKCLKTSNKGEAPAGYLIMDKKELYENIKNNVLNFKGQGSSKILRNFRDKGGTKEEALKIYNKLMEEYHDGDPEYDILLDIGDYIYGWCLPEKRIWD
jgi:hypothetical protein